MPHRSVKANTTEEQPLNLAAILQIDHDIRQALMAALMHTNVIEQATISGEIDTIQKANQAIQRALVETDCQLTRLKNRATRQNLAE